MHGLEELPGGAELDADVHAGHHPRNAIACDGRTWTTSPCSVSLPNANAVELSADGDGCSCSTGYIVRPCVGNMNWGGANGPTCNAASQTLSVDCY